METKATSVCFVVGFLGVVAAAAGFAAEATRTKITEVYVSVETASCLYPSSPAYALGLVAAIILFLVQVIINISTGCACFRGQAAPSNMLNSNITLQRILSTFSWMAFIAGFVLFMVGTVFRRQKPEAKLIGDYYWCYVVKPGIFAGASVLTLVSVGAGIGYINLVFKPAVPTTNDVEGQGPVPIGQPQFGQQQQQFNKQQQQQQQQQYMPQPQQQMVMQPPMGLAEPVQYPPPNPHY